jgi:hypothetical protein
MKTRAMTDIERAEAVAALRAFSRPDRPQGPLDWAHKLRFRELSGERLSAYQRDAWREALHGGTPVRNPDSVTDQ